MSTNKNYKWGFDFGRQIVIDKRKKNSIAFLNHLILAPLTEWSKMHALRDVGKDDRKSYSIIKLLAQDYSQGTGAASVFCYYNFYPSDIKLLKHIIDGYYNEFYKKFFKAMPQTGHGNFWQVTLTRNPNMNNPWIIEVTNGECFDAKPKQGTVKTVKQFFTDDQIFILITTVYDFLRIWENTFVGELFKIGYKESAKAIIAYNQQNSIFQESPHNQQINYSSQQQMKPNQYSNAQDYTNTQHTPSSNSHYYNSGKKKPQFA